MENLSTYLEPYKRKIALVAAFCTVMQYFTGLLVCYAIHKRGNVCGYSPVPFVASLIVGALGLKYSELTGDTVSHKVYLISMVIHLAYIIFYSLYSENKWKDIAIPLLFASAVITIVYSYAELEEEQKIKFRFGVIITTVLLIIMALPLRNLREIRANRDSSYIPCVSVTASFLVAILWIAYSLTISNTYLLIQNICAAIISGIQFVICVIYPRQREDISRPQVIIT